MRSAHFFCCVCLVLALSPRAEPQAGVITGLVLDERGVPVEAAHVTWISVAKGVVEVQVGPVEFVVTDKAGRFMIPGLEVGTPYQVYAQKEEENYADMSLGFYNPKGTAVTATAAAQGKASDVTVQVGPKAGRLNWEVTDAATGKPVNPTLTVTRTDAGGSIGGGGPANDSYLVPSDADLAFSVSAPGYLTWYYSAGEQKRRAPLRLKPGEEKTVKIQLQPEK